MSERLKIEPSNGVGGDPADWGLNSTRYWRDQTAVNDPGVRGWRPSCRSRASGKGRFEEVGCPQDPERSRSRGQGQTVYAGAAGLSTFSWPWGVEPAKSSLARGGQH